MDVGDNVGGGSPGDFIILFAELIRQRVRNGLVILYGADAVERCVAAGVRADVELNMGGSARTSCSSRAWSRQA
jgi:microcystin degradation protein MlrC